MNIILNADDLGMNPEVNQAIFSLMSERRITSATIMANGSAVEEAVKQQAEFPHCSFGIHLNGSQFYPLTQSAGLSPLLDSSGCFIPNRLRQVGITPSLCQALFEEWSAQIEHVQRLGVRISHFDSHHHVHTVSGILPIIAQLKNRFVIKKIRLTKNIFSTNEHISIKKQLKKMRIRKKVYYPGDFSFFDDDNWSISLIDAYNAVEMIGPNGWDELKNHSPIKNIKYGDNIVINKIYHNMVFTHPSKLHYTVIMRNL